LESLLLGEFKEIGHLRVLCAVLALKGGTDLNVYCTGLGALYLVSLQELAFIGLFQKVFSLCAILEELSLVLIYEEQGRRLFVEIFLGCGHLGLIQLVAITGKFGPSLRKSTHTQNGGRVD